MTTVTNIPPTAAQQVHVPTPTIATPVKIPVGDFFRQLVESERHFTDAGADALWNEIENHLPSIAKVFLPHSVQSYTDLFLTSVEAVIPPNKTVDGALAGTWMGNIEAMVVANEPVLARFVEKELFEPAIRAAFVLAGINFAA